MSQRGPNSKPYAVGRPRVLEAPDEVGEFPTRTLADVGADVIKTIKPTSYIAAGNP